MNSPWWSARALHHFYSLHPAHAERVDRAVLLLATTGEGDLRAAPGDTSAPFRLHVPPFVVSVSLDKTTARIHVWSILRAQRP